MTSVYEHLRACTRPAWVARVSPLTLSIVLLVVLRLPWLLAIIHRDEGLFGYEGFLLMQGGLPYVDVVDHHGLSLYVLYGISYWLFGTSIIPMRVLTLLLHVLMLIALYDISKRWFGITVARWTALLFALFSNLPVFEAPFALTESLATPFAVVGVALYERYRADDTRSIALYMLAWFLLAFATSIRFTLAFMVLMLALVVVVDTLGDVRRTWLARVEALLWRGAIAAAMGALVWGVIVLYLAARGALGAFGQILGETFLYGTQAAYVGVVMRVFLLQQGLPMFALSALAVLALLLGFRQLGRGHYVLIWWTLVFAYVVTRPQMLGHYFVQVLPVGAMLAALGVIALIAFFEPFTRHRAYAVGGALVVVLGLFLYSAPLAIGQYPDMRPPTASASVFSYADSRSRADQHELSRVVRQAMATARAENPAAQLYVYGNAPATYWLAEEFAPVRDTYAINNYAWVVHEHGDPPPFALARADDTAVVVLFDAYLRQPRNDVTYYVTTFYDFVARVGSATVYQRR